MNGTIGTSANAGWKPPRCSAAHESTPGPITYGQKLRIGRRRIQSATSTAAAMNPTSAEFLKIYGDSCDILFRNFGVGEMADKAIAAYTAGSEADPDPARKYKMINRIGAIYFNMGDIEKSMATYEKVLAADPGNLEALSGKGLVLAASGEKPKMEEAVGIFQQVVEKANAPEHARLRAEAETNMKYLTDTLKIEVAPAKKDKKDDKKKKK